MSALAQPPLAVRTHHKFRKILSYFLQKSAESESEESHLLSFRKMSELDKTSFLSDYGTDAFMDSHL